jgi:hypothetical protein
MKNKIILLLNINTKISSKQWTPMSTTTKQTRTCSLSEPVRCCSCARASIEAAPRVAELMAREVGTDEAWRKKAVEDYEKVAQGYVLKQDQWHESTETT